MPDMLNTASAWLDEVHGEQASTTVVYSRGAAATGSIAATIGATDFTLELNDSEVDSWKSRDYLIAAADLEIEEQAVIPQRGDRITEGTRIYEVLSPGDAPVWEYSDVYHRMMRIHTKLIRET